MLWLQIVLAFIVVYGASGASALLGRVTDLMDHAREMSDYGNAPAAQKVGSIYSSEQGALMVAWSLLYDYLSDSLGVQRHRAGQVHGAL